MKDLYEDFFQEIVLKATFDMVAKRWPAALDGHAMSWIRENRSELYHEAEVEIYPKLNELFGADMDEFKIVVIRYGKALVKCFEAYGEHIKNLPMTEPEPEPEPVPVFPRPEHARAQERLL